MKRITKYLFILPLFLMTITGCKQSDNHNGSGSNPTSSQTSETIREDAKESFVEQAKSKVYDQILKNLVKDEEDQYGAYLLNAGVNNKFLTEQCKYLFDVLFPEDSTKVVTVDSFAEAVVRVLSTTMGKLNEAANSDDPEIAATYAIFAEGGEAYISDEELADLQTEISEELGNMLTELSLANEETGEIVSFDEFLRIISESENDQD